MCACFQEVFTNEINLFTPFSLLNLSTYPFYSISHLTLDHMLYCIFNSTFWLNSCIAL